MHVLVIFCHPCEESYGAALAATVREGLEAGGHEVRFRDLYAEDFRPALSAAERRGYHDADNTLPVADHVADVRWAEALVFVYPTWWYNLPAMMKGWLDRVLLPHVAFTLPTATQGIRGNLRNIRRIAVVTTCGATWPLSKLMGEPARRTLTRGLRAICHPFCRTSYTALYKMDTVSADKRAAFLVKVRAKMAALR